MSRFVIPQTVRLTLENGDWLLVRRRLNAGEHHDMLKRCTTTDAEGNAQHDRLATGWALTSAYLVDWSLLNTAGQREPLDGLDPAGIEAVLRHLDPEDFFEIRRAIDQHVIDQAAAREAEKKTTPGGASESSRNSMSLVGAGGGTNG